MIKRLISILCVLTGFLFISCSIGINVFIVNNSKEDFTIEAYFNENLNQLTENNLPLVYEDSIINIDKKTTFLLNKKTPYNLKDSSTISFILPKNSTLHFIRTSNNFIFLDSIKIIEKNKIIQKEQFSREKGTNFLYEIR